MAKQRGRPQEKDRINRADLVELAFQEFSEKGFDGVSIRRLAARVGVSDSLFIHHFGSKQQLWNEVVDSLIDREFKHLIANLQPGDFKADPLSWLKSNFVEFLRLAPERPAMFRMLFNELSSGSERSQYLKRCYLVPYVALFDHAIDLCRERGLIRPVPNHALHTLLLGAVNILIQPDILQQARSADSPPIAPFAAEDLVDIIFNGVQVQK